jgi:hypothetical protein
MAESLGWVAAHAVAADEYEDPHGGQGGKDAHPVGESKKTLFVPAYHTTADSWLIIHAASFPFLGFKQTGTVRAGGPGTDSPRAETDSSLSPRNRSKRNAAGEKVSTATRSGGDAYPGRLHAQSREGPLPIVWTACFQIPSQPRFRGTRSEL